MLSQDELRQRIQLGEDTVTELKSKSHGLPAPSIAKAIVALANTRGGSLIIGVEDDGSVTGIGDRQKADGLIRQVSQVCHHAVKPPIACAQELQQLDGHNVLVVEVAAYSPDRPYKVDHIYYIRDGNRSREATQSELRRLLMSHDYHFDEAPVRGTTFDELAPEAIRELLSRLYDDAPETGLFRRYLERLKCVDEDGTPTTAGILFCARRVRDHLLDARISAVRFAGTTMTDQFVDRKELDGRLTEQVEGAEEFIKRHLPSPAEIAGWDRKEKGIPRAVFREAVRNAVTHRDYRVSSQTRLFVFDDRVELRNPGELLNRLTLDNIRAGITQQRNPVIAALLNRLERRESLGGGIPRMIRLMREAELPEPEFDVAGGHFQVTLRLHAKR